MQARLHPFDLAIVALYLVAITLFGLRFARRGANRDKSLRGYFLADKSIPWWAIALSIVSAETSTLTIIGTPGLAFAGDFGFLQIVIGYMLGRIVVAVLFLPRYFHGEMLTAYQLIDRRFGHTLHRVTAGLFLLTRAAAEGVRVFAVSIVVSIAIGTGDIWSIAIICALTLLYTFEGGMTAVIWTDVVQMAIYIAGTLVAVWSLGAHVPGGWAAIHTTAAAAGKFHMFNFALNLTTTYTFWAGVLGGTFLTMASHGTDQLMVQRMLAAKNLNQSRAALLSSGVVIFIQFALFLLIGAGLWVFYGLHPAALATTDGNRIFPAFIAHEMPTGIAGLLIAAILAAAMSNLSAALNSLSSTTVVDFYMGFRPHAKDAERIAVSRLSTVFWALVLFAVAVYAVRAGGKGNVVEIGLSIASVAYGCLLGVFLLGTLTRYATQAGAIVGMIVGFIVNLLLWRAPGRLLFASFAVPRVAWTWYVIIGASVTFVVGLAASVVLGRRQSQTKTKNAAVTVGALIVFLLLCAPNVLGQKMTPPAQPAPSPQYDFSAVSAVINTAIAQKKLPGAVAVVGHNGKVVFEQAYGVRKLAGEPGVDGKPSPAEPMTLDTIFDMASMTKVLVTTTAIMQLYEQGKLALDEPVAKYLPEFGANGKQRVTIRELLTHYSGLPPDVDLKDTWGLAGPDKAEGLRRAMTAKLEHTPGTHFEYSDINFMVLGALVEKLSSETLDDYAQKHIFAPLGMSRTRFHLSPYYCSCGDPEPPAYGSAVWYEPKKPAPSLCNGNVCVLGPEFYNSDIAPTQHDDQGTAQTNPDFDHLLRGTVHDPTARRMGGVAGQAGVFSTAHDISLFAQALLDKLLHNTGPFPLQQSTLRLMTLPAQPTTAESGATVFRQDGTTTTGVALRGLGWDINSAYSRPRGSFFPTLYSKKSSSEYAASASPAVPPPSFGHTGFTGTSLWIDPSSNTYVILLANSVHPRGNPSISPLRGQVATAAAKALGLSQADVLPDSAVPNQPSLARAASATEVITAKTPTPSVLTGVDVLEQSHFKALTDLAAKHAGHLRIGLLTNQTGLDSQGHRTIDILRGDAARSAGIQLVRLFSPEHGLFGKKDSTNIGPETDVASGLPVVSLYGATDDERRPKPADLRDLDAVVIDLQDAGVRFYTYETVLGYFLEASACEPTIAGRPLEIVVLDRPDPIGGEAVEGPVSAPPWSYINYTALPLRHGMTIGELAQFLASKPQTCKAQRDGQTHIGLDATAELTVMPMQSWQRSDYFAQTGLTWVNPSPNLRNVDEAVLYPALGMLDYSNVSVGRGTDTPFEVFGANWFNGPAVAAYLTARHIPGVSFEATHFAIADDTNHYPYHGQTIEGVRLTIADRNALDSPELGIEILSALYHLYPTQFQLEKAAPLIANPETMAVLAHGDDPRTIAAGWTAALNDFKAQRAKYLLYP
ncbi:MAG TPA: sodium/solute symporter [Acidobacteriaceae bacterium]